MAKQKDTGSVKQEQTLAEKLALIDKISKEVNEKAGKVIVGRLSSTPEMMDKLTIKFIPSICHDFNEATGGGYPRSRCTLIAGNPDSGKTSRILEDVGYNQKLSGDFTCCWIESENSLDKTMVCETFGIDPERFVFINYDANKGAEGILDILYGFMTAVKFDMIVINSLKCLVPTKILEEAMDAQTPAVQARLWSKMVAKFLALVANNETAFILITHLYTGIGTYGSPQVISGGAAIRYWSALTLSFNRKTIVAGEPITKEEGVHIEVSIKKNHCVTDQLPYKKFDYYAVFGEGTERILTSIKPFVAAGIMAVSGASYVIYNEDGSEFKKLVGKNKYRQFMKDNPDIFNSLMTRLGTRISTVQEMSDEEVSLVQTEEDDIIKVVKELDIKE